MQLQKLSSGLWPVMLTPFLENNQIDNKGLQDLTHFYINTGADGLFANCLSSEMFQLTDKERLQVIHTVVSSAQSTIPVVATGTFSRDLKKCSEFIKQVYDTGVDAVIVITNLLADIEDGDDVFKKNMETLIKLTEDIPLGVYECPDPYKRLLSTQLIQWLGETERFLYHKDTSCNPEAIKNKLKVIEGSNLSLYNANTTTALYSLDIGARGISPIGANLYPELYTFMIREFKLKGKTESLSQLNAQLDMMDAIVEQCYPFSAKYFLQERGLPITTSCRVPYGKIKAENYIKLNALMDVLMHTSEYFGVDMENVVL